MTKSIWELADEAAREVAAWPDWKRRAADTALVSRPEDDPRHIPRLQRLMNEPSVLEMPHRTTPEQARRVDEIAEVLGVPGWAELARVDKGVYELGELWYEETDPRERAELLTALRAELRPQGVFTGQETSLLVLISLGKVPKHRCDLVLSRLGPDAAEIAQRLLHGANCSREALNRAADALKEWARK